MPPRNKRLITAEDLYRLELMTDCRLSPDGAHVVYAVQRVDAKTEKKHANLWLAPTDGGPPRPFTHGDQTDSQPRWSPDGSHIAFLSNRQDEKQPQIYLIPLAGGEAQRLTDLKGEFGPFEWSPDGRRLVCQFRLKDQEAQEREKDAHKKELGVAARHITRVYYKLDGTGYLPRERWHLWLVDVPGGRARQLTAGEIHDERQPAWSPDGREVVFVSNRSPDPDLDPDVMDVWVIPAAGGEMRRVETPLGQKSLPSFSPDGRWIACVCREGRSNWWKNDNLWVTAADGSVPPRNLTGAYDIHVSSDTLNDVGGSPAMTPPTWSNDGQRLYFQVTRRGRGLLQSVALDGGDLQAVIDEAGVVGPYSFDRQQARLAYFMGRMDDPCQVWLREMAGGQARQLSAVNGKLLRGLDLGEVEEVWFEGAAGNDLQGWILKPPGFEPGKQYPSILEIHGGPLVQYGYYFMHEFYYLAAQGYVVYFTNPRGGQGYGEAHAKAVWGAWGTVDYDDLMVWVDYVAGQPYIDRARMGVTGGSYGGYMTNWIIGHTDRFRAAVTQRSVSNLISMWGSSDFNWIFQQDVNDQPPWQAMEEYWARSPMKYIGHAKTPTLVIHSQQDLRCAQEQSEQVFVALKVLGVDTELVLFPDEPHGLSRGGRTDRRVVRLQHILRWFDRYLK